MLSRLLRLARGDGAILCGHGIATEESAIHISLQQLDEALDVASALGSIIPLAELAHRYMQGKSTKALFSITFDDGYESLRVAVPLLARRGIPATVFVVSSGAQ
ncbi:MAG: polysaccharide deacetylase family protein, partial [Longimicrobiales bacterium]